MPNEGGGVDWDNLDDYLKRSSDYQNFDRVKPVPVDEDNHRKAEDDPDQQDD
jgi:hypothetical protein